MRHLLTQLKNQGYYLNGIKTWLSPTNNLLITYLSPTNHLLKSRAHRCTQFAVTLLVMVVLSVGNMWGETEISFSPLAKVQKSSGVYVISNNTTPSSLNPSSTNGWKVDGNPIRISSFSANITKIVFTGKNIKYHTYVMYTIVDGTAYRWLINHATLNKK